MDNIKHYLYNFMCVFFGILIYINKYIRQSYSFEEYSSINTGKYTEKGYPIDDDASKDIEKIIIIYKYWSFWINNVAKNNKFY